LKKKWLAIVAALIVWVAIAMLRAKNADRQFKNFIAQSPQSTNESIQKEWLAAQPDMIPLYVRFLRNPFRNAVAIDYSRGGQYAFYIWFTAHRQSSNAWRIENRHGMGG
jgi:hypothetical protein